MPTTFALAVKEEGAHNVHIGIIIYISNGPSSIFCLNFLCGTLAKSNSSSKCTEFSCLPVCKSSTTLESRKELLRMKEQRERHLHMLCCARFSQEHMTFFYHVIPHSDFPGCLKRKSVMTRRLRDRMPGRYSEAAEPSAYPVHDSWATLFLSKKEKIR